MMPFLYPGVRPIRRHEPRGYADYSSYRPWLRDEFTFRCVFCLVREQWGRVTGLFDLDHFLPISRNQEKKASYENLLYCCARCNRAKGDRGIPDPREVLTQDTVAVEANGEIEASTSESQLIVRRLRLDDRESVEFRRMWIRIIAMSQFHDPPLHRQLVGFPPDLPNLSRLRPPAGNGRPEGIQVCYFAQRESGTLPSAY
jgi:hypothetical protein